MALCRARYPSLRSLYLFAFGTLEIGGRIAGWPQHREGKMWLERELETDEKKDVAEWGCFLDTITRFFQDGLRGSPPEKHSYLS